MRTAHTLAMGLWTVLGPTAAQPDGRPSLTVRVYTYAGLSDKDLANAELIAQSLFRKAGIDTAWIDCPKERGEEIRYPACRKPANAADVFLYIVPRSMEGYAVGQKAFGFALPSTTRQPARQAYVFYDRVEQAARQNRKVNLATLLAYVIVHETGHLLLGPSMHFNRGIMRPRWQPEDLRDMERGSLVFTADQARAMQGRVLERVRSETDVR